MSRNKYITARLMDFSIKWHSWLFRCLTSLYQSCTEQTQHQSKFEVNVNNQDVFAKFLSPTHCSYQIFFPREKCVFSLHFLIIYIFPLIYSKTNFDPPKQRGDSLIFKKYTGKIFLSFCCSYKATLLAKLYYTRKYSR